MKIVCVNRKRRVALLDDHKTEVPFDAMYDAEGEETPDAEEAISATLELPSGLWVVLDLREWHPPTLH